MDKIKRIGIISLAKFQAILGTFIGLACGILYSVGGLIIDLAVTMGWISSTETPGLSLGTLLAFGALIGMPMILMLAGFLLGLVEAVLYNFYAKWFGGLRLTIELNE